MHSHRNEDEYTYVLEGEAIGALQQRYGLEMDFESMGPIAEREGLDLPG